MAVAVVLNSIVAPNKTLAGTSVLSILTFCVAESSILAFSSLTVYAFLVLFSIHPPVSSSTAKEVHIFFLCFVGEVAFKS